MFNVIRLPWLIALSSLVIFLLAYASPVELVDADPAAGLLASQAILDHGTLDLTVYLDHPDLAYDLDNDYRIFQRDDTYYHYSLGLPIFSLPAVWPANRLGFDMLNQAHEFALQNLLSALSSVAVFILLFVLGRRLVTPWISYVIALLTTLGSPVMSTLATGLWNVDYQIVLICALLWFALDGFEKDWHWQQVGLIMLLFSAAFLCRPTSAFLVLAFLVCLLGAKSLLLAYIAGFFLIAIVLSILLSGFNFLPWIPDYYAPRKAWPHFSWLAFKGIVLSPSRGLFVYSPFLLPVLAGLIWKWRVLLQDRFYRWVALWLLLHMLGAACHQIWWGGWSFGPRQMTELIPGFFLLTCWVWRQCASDRQRRLFAAAYVLLALPAVVIHSYQGLFNPATQQWNAVPDIDQHPELLWDWRYPQFLATEAALDERYIAWRRPSVTSYPMAQELSYDSDQLIFLRWAEAEDAWRWSLGKSPGLLFMLDTFDPDRTYLLELYAGALGRQEVTVSLNGVTLGNLTYEGFDPIHQFLIMRGDTLVKGDNRLRLQIPDAASVTDDSRVLGLALRSLRLYPMANDSQLVNFDDDAFFAAGWSEAEEDWRWSDGSEAELRYPMAEVARPFYLLQLKAGALGNQRVEIFLNDHRLDNVELHGFQPQLLHTLVAGEILQPYQANRIEFRFPDARSTAQDSRQLGMAFSEARLRPLRVLEND